MRDRGDRCAWRRRPRREAFSKEGLGELSKRMGNSEAVCKRHYLETLTREEGAAWFKIRRSKAAALNLFRWILQKLLSFVSEYSTWLDWQSQSR